MRLLGVILLLVNAADVSAVVGEWIGKSVCVGNRAACVDEQNVYVFTPSASAGVVDCTAYKIVNGERVEMGRADYRYDDRTHRLTWEFKTGTTHGFWEFVVSGTTMEARSRSCRKRASCDESPSQNGHRRPRGRVDAPNWRRVRTHADRDRGGQRDRRHVTVR